MGSYYIWHPSWVSTQPPTLETFVTLGESFFLSRGGVEVVTQIMHHIGIDETPRSWSFTGGRSHYFTDYFEDPEQWEDRWSLAWRARAVNNTIRQLVEVPRSGYFDVYLKDPSYFEEGSPENWSTWPCFIVADLRDQDAFDAIGNILTSPCVVGYTVGKAFDHYPQVRIDLGERPRSWYEAGAQEAELLLEALRRAGASIRFHETTEWLENA